MKANNENKQRKLLTYRLIAILLAVAVGVGMAACGGGGGDLTGLNLPGQLDTPETKPNPTTGQPEAPTQQLPADAEQYFPAFPQASATRSVSRSDFPLVLTGSQAYADSGEAACGWSRKSDSADPDEDDMLLPPTAAGKICWVEYRVGNMDGELLSTLTLSGGTAGSGSYYLLVADWTQQRWDAHLFNYDNRQLTGTNLRSADHISATGDFVWCIAVFYDAEGVVHSWTLDADTDDVLAPYQLIASNGTSETTVYLSWQHPDPEASTTQPQGYRICRHTEPTGDFELIQTVGYINSSTDQPPTIGDYWYYVVAFADGEVSPPSNLEAGHRLSVPTAILAVGGGQTSGDLPHVVDFDATGSYDLDGDIENYEWDFDGDDIFGESGAESAAAGQATVQYTYNSGGQFDAQVQVTDADNATAADSVVIAVNIPPTADLAASPTSGDAPLPVNFDATGSADLDGTIDNYEWDFDGDGVFGETGDEADAEGDSTVQFTYGGGVFNPAVKVTDNKGSTDTDTVNISVNNDPPVADLVIGAGQGSGNVPHTVNFDASGSTDLEGDIENYQWDFDGDDVFNETGAEADAEGSATPTYTYNAGGEYEPQVKVFDEENATDTDSVTVSVNFNPTADLAVGAGQTSGNVPHTVEFDATGSTDLDGTIDNYEWDFDGDGVFNETGAEATSEGDSKPDYTYSEYGVYDPVVRVTDDDGATDTATIQIDVNDFPAADLTIGSGEGTGNTPHTVNFDATGSGDLDGTIANYEWDFDGDGVFSETGAEANAEGDSITQYTYGQGGTFNPAVRVTDNDGATDTDSISIEVNSSPIAVIAVGTDQQTGTAPHEVDFSATSSDDLDGTIENYEWDLDGDGVFNETGAEADAEGSTTVTYTYSNNGVFDAKVRVTDDDGATDTDAIQITVNAPPIADLRIPTGQESGDTPHPVSFDASGSDDPDGTIENYEWDFDADGNFNETGMEADAEGDDDPQVTYTTGGNFNATVRVTDNLGATDTAFVSLDINNSPEAVLEVGTDQTDGTAPHDVDFDASDSTDVEDPLANFEWDLDGDGVFNETGAEANAEGNATVTYTYSVYGDYDPVVRVTDTDGATDTATIEIQVNDPPVADLAIGENEDVGDVPHDVNFDASGSTDTEDVPADLNYQWDFNGDGLFSETDEEDASEGNDKPQYTYNAPGVFTAQVRVIDTDGGTDTDNVTITVNGDPDPPATVTATDHNSTLQVNWSESTGANYYQVWRADSFSGPYDTQIGGNISGLSTPDNTRDYGVQYWYKVKASADGIDWSDLSTAYDSGYSDLNTPEITDIGRGNATYISIDWTNVSDRDHYELWRGEDPGVYDDEDDYDLVYYDTTSYYADDDIEKGKTYYYCVKAIADYSPQADSELSDTENGWALPPLPVLFNSVANEADSGFEVNFDSQDPNWQVEHWLYFFVSDNDFANPSDEEWNAIINNINHRGPAPVATEDHSGPHTLSAGFAGNPDAGDYIWFRFYSVKYGEGSWNARSECRKLHYDG